MQRLKRGERFQLDELVIKVEKVEGADDLPLPRYMTPLAAGMDLLANIENTIVLEPGKFKMIPCGIKIELPEGCEAQIRPRSGLAAKYGISILNSPGTVDADYRGEIRVLLINHGDKKVCINRGDRIAQIVVARVTKVKLVEKSNLRETSRGEGGFGHTGI
ncbi:MAG: dUTP diphosphatase [Thermoanaerobacterales bacterium]|jgi:dUTP pyrophosphatase|nr:dUTP diphosphatase [Thermoanaerobacterales bacterium]